MFQKFTNLTTPDRWLCRLGWLAQDGLENCPEAMFVDDDTRIEKSAVAAAGNWQAVVSGIADRVWSRQLPSRHRRLGPCSGATSRNSNPISSPRSAIPCNAIALCASGTGNLSAVKHCKHEVCSSPSLLHNPIASCHDAPRSLCAGGAGICRA